jgi:hypothetical protein
MLRVALPLVLTATIGAALLAGQADAARTVTFPSPASSCTTRPPRVLTAGASPRRPLRLELRGDARRTATQLMLDQVHARTLSPDGKWLPHDSETRVVGVYTTGRPVAGRLPLTSRVRMPGASKAFATRLARVRMHGFVDTLDGGVTRTTLLPGHRTAADAKMLATLQGDDGVENDHLPRQPIGIGATWRVVKCDPIDDTPARETRTYTLRSVAGGVLQASFRDVVTLDPAHVDLGSGTTKAGLLHFRLVSLSGSASGTLRLPLSDFIAEQVRSTTALHVVFKASAAGGKSTLIHTEIVDRQTVALPD